MSKRRRGWLARNAVNEECFGNAPLSLPYLDFPPYLNFPMPGPVICFVSN